MLYEDSAMFIAVEDSYETNFVFRQTKQMWCWLCLYGPTFCLYLCIAEFTVCCGMLLQNRLRHSVCNNFF